MPVRRNTFADILARVSPCPNTGCWFWLGRVARDGYAEANYAGERYRQLHRLFYETFVGPVPTGKELHHRCETKLCCNPWHAEPVTKVEHGIAHQHAARWQRAKTHCPKGHPYNTQINRGGRRCSICHAAQSNASYHRQRNSEIRV